MRPGTLWFVLAAMAAAPAMAVPPPPPPIATLAGPAPLCSAGFAIMLGANETANQHGPTHWAVNGPEGELGIRAFAAADGESLRDAYRSRRELVAATIPGIERAERHRIFEYPGNRQRGWGYWIPFGGADGPAFVWIVSDRFEGTDRDYPALRRVLTGESRTALCASSSADEGRENMSRLDNVIARNG